ncbi:efflux RND transporter periplasmic adaptor subunit [Rhizobium sp. P32RR-XVIII]|uniref:efflux RND transporter periplasmic adaptor subunit n=1 Tax=Rhizobium sp. P32RR-XVIII TaxID=2726738 RepID=UPI00145661C3|nr:efflux RND transporter periplasmic adaptor subunit [Rhizobium sp. P32RR-XVIII]NLS07549.1 efflux RND transporter periplasmic adaptor subunit [Rhizobium sp. P32RR-XVIII]
MKRHLAASRSRATFGVCAAVLAAFFLVGCQREDEAEERPPRPVKTVAVSFNPEDTYGSLVGEIRPRTETSLSFRQGGEIRERDVEVGDLVEVGTVLARLDAEDAQDAVRKAEANVFSAQTQFRNAETERARQQQLYPRTSTRQAFEAAIAQANMAQAGVDAAQASLRIAQTNLDNRVLKANAAGVVTAIGGEVGQVVGGGQMVVRVAQLGTRDAVFQVPEATIQTTGGDARVDVQLLSNANIKATGTVREISPTADPITRNFTVRVGLDTAPDEFRFGSAVRGTIRLSGEPTARLPITALFSQGSQSAVWIVDAASKTTKLVPVEVHRFDAKDFLVTKGLSSGDNVVVAGVQQLRPGMPVRLLEGSAE